MVQSVYRRAKSYTRACCLLVCSKVLSLTANARSSHQLLTRRHSFQSMRWLIHRHEGPPDGTVSLHAMWPLREILTVRVMSMMLTTE